MSVTPISSYQVGDGVNCYVEVVNRVGQLFDPDQIVLQVKNPNGVETSVTPTKLAVGKYEAVFVLNVAGTWVRRWKVFGNTYGSDEVKIRCQPTAFTNP